MKHGRLINKAVVLLCTCLALLSLPMATVLADMGPKPEIVVTVVNPPEGEYYLDLLTKEENNYMHLELADYDPEKISLLEGYGADGWKPGLVKGTRAPMWGALTGIPTEKGIEHRFGYMGVPDDFKLIIVTPDNKLVVSQEIHRSSLKTVLTYDYQRNTVLLEKPVTAYIKQFFGTCSATLFIEGILLLVFGFSLKRNWLPVLLTNLFTQIALTLSIGVLFQKEGLLTASIVFYPVEFIIIITESILFALFLGEHSRLRRIGYAVFANILSAAIGLAIMMYVYP